MSSQKDFKNMKPMKISTEHSSLDSGNTTTTLSYGAISNNTKNFDITSNPINFDNKRSSYHDNNRFLEPSYKSDFDFEPIYKTEIDLVKKFLSINDNILFISSFNRNFSDYYIELKKKKDYYFDSDFNLDAFENKWKDEINDNAIAKLTFLQEVNSILADLSEYNLFV